MNHIIIYTAEYLYLVVLLVAAIFFFKQPRKIQKSMIVCGVIIAPVSYILAKIGSHLYYDTRPFVVGHFTPLIAHAADNGFPSDHMLLVSAVAMIVTFYNKRLGAVLWVLALFVGIARVLSGVHHVTDIVGSIVFVLIAAAIYYFTVGKKQIEREKNPLENRIRI
ncbi:phosphatase PAP2 family protein [Patescibacteria group bacterium]|nr:phosphatase PAP2 family protein [Patescibacteria group bacterium]MCL5114496.1 phosphatase PAP2 family protein [Patescibacteria group bacterium]